MKNRDLWHFTFTPEQTDTIKLVLNYAFSELRKGSVGDLAKTVASSRIKDIIDLINNTTG